MNVLESKPASNYEDDLKKIIKLLTYKNYKIQLKGSSSLASQRYFSDYDLFCVIPKSEKDGFYKFISDLIDGIEGNEDGNIFFMELKMQTQNGNKTRVYPKQKLNKSSYEKSFDKLDFIKIDLICSVDNRLVEVSCIYSFSSSSPTQSDYINSLVEDIKELKKEKKYYKILKREFNIQKAKGNKEELVRLSKIFNSDLGKEYKLISNLEALQSLLEFYQSPKIKKRVIINLKDLHLPDDIEQIDDFIKEKSKRLNTKAKALL